MRRILSYDPLTKETIYFDYSDDDKMTLTHSYDVSESLELSKSLANDEDRTKRGIKNDLWHYAHIPVGVAMDMLVKHGVDIHNKDHQGKLFKLLNTEYKHCKTTHLTHNVKHG